ncbi:MAG: hypothetical protein PHH75_01905 [Candidatus Omnitrophica bacterium]|nr:hypothetical protein [Candidatus Omnitrophota bacterium]MDD5573914.1 hypothetical protein [Candidatus Omnitrophota bacterium]
MKQMKVSAVVGLAVTVLAVVTAFAFSFASMSYQAEVTRLKKVNAEYQKTLENYKVVLDNIRVQLEQAKPAAGK